MMPISTFQILLISIITSAFIVLYIYKSKTCNIKSESETFQDSGDFVSSQVLQLSDYGSYISRLLAFTPGLSSGKDIIVYPRPSKAWTNTYEVNKRKLCIETINKYFIFPNTLHIFTEPSFQGRMTIIPFDPIPKNQSFKISADEVNHMVLFKEYLKFRTTTGNPYSCIVPNGYKVIIKYEGSELPDSVLESGPHATIVCPSTIFSITILPTHAQQTNQSWQVVKN